MTTRSAYPIDAEKIARMIAGELEGNDNLVADGKEWFLNDEAGVDGDKITLRGEVSDHKFEVEEIEIILQVRSITRIGAEARQ